MGEEGCCSPLICNQSKEGDYCDSYLKDLKFAYLMYQDTYEIIQKDPKNEKTFLEIFDKNFNKIYGDMDKKISKFENTIFNPKKYLVKFRDIDPDTGDVSQDEIIAACDNELIAKWVLHALISEWYSPQGSNDPNRDFYIKEI